MLCGYSPFRSDDTKQLIAETTKAQVTFHERYWKNVSQEGEWTLFYKYGYLYDILSM